MCRPEHPYGSLKFGDEALQLQVRLWPEPGYAGVSFAGEEDCLSDGERIVKVIRQALFDDNELRSFLDVHDIAPRLPFDKVILNHLRLSAVVAISGGRDCLDRDRRLAGAGCRAAVRSAPRKLEAHFTAATRRRCSVKSVVQPHR